ncbi:MAG: hypothetical protein LBO64_10075 [Desulfovibrio sp.]|jgi:hypothetical protein|nr:hypothetical protein [Desulfovibrio sp.]
MFFDNIILNTAVLAFVGGVFGSCLGGLWVFCLDCFLVLAGSVVLFCGGSDFLLFQIGLGPLFGPQSTFLGGTIAAAYAAGIKKNHPGGSGKDIISPLLDTSWDVLAVGGLGAVVCALLVVAMPHIPVLNRSDHLALPIVLVSMVGRFIFYRETPLGQAESIKKHGQFVTDNYNLSWAGWMSPPSRLFFVGMAAGGISGAMAMFTQQALQPLAAAGKISVAAAGTVPVLFFWGVSGLMLTALFLGKGPVQKVPVTHGIAVLGAAAYLNSGSLLVSIAAGIGAAFLQELMARLFYNHGSDHVDPPASAIAVGIFIYSFIPWKLFS